MQSQLLAEIVKWQGPMKDAPFCRDVLKWERSHYWRMKHGQKPLTLRFVRHVLGLRPDLAPFHTADLMGGRDAA